MKLTIPIFLFVAFASAMCAQERQLYIYHDNNSHLVWGDYYYKKSIKGLGSLMTDLKTLDPELSLTLAPQFKALRKKHSEANMILGVGGGLGGLLLVAGYLSKKSETEYQYLGQSGILENTSPNYGLMIAGTTISISSFIIASIKWTKSEDILGFVNQFNQHTKGEKLEISLYPDIGFDNGLSGGISLCLGF
ncbi:MAG: hypothetical protein AAFZ15_22590 [Bacteroidota bacterium]